MVSFRWMMMGNLLLDWNFRFWLEWRVQRYKGGYYGKEKEQKLFPDHALGNILGGKFTGHEHTLLFVESKKS